MAKQKLSYSEAIQQIETIIEEIQSNQLDVDELSEKVKIVSTLIKTCKTKLHNTEIEIEKILNEMDE